MRNQHLTINPELTPQERKYARKKAYDRIPLKECCEICGVSALIEKLARGHFDYNKPTEIVCCCRKCHSKLDKLLNPSFKKVCLQERLVRSTNKSPIAN